MRCTAKSRSSSLRWSCAVSWPPSRRSGSTTRSELAPWLSTYPITTVACDSIASRSAASAPDGVVAIVGDGGPVGGGQVAAADRGDDRGDGGVRASRRGAAGARRAGSTRAQQVAAGDPDGAVGRLDDGCGAELAQPREEYVDGHGRDQHGRRDPAQPEGAGLGVVQQLGQRGLVVGAQERLGLADPHGAEGAGHVVDEVGQRLGDRGARHGARRSRAPRAPTSRRRRRGGPSRW